MVCDDCFHIWHAAVTEPQVAFVEELPVLVVRREVLFNKTSELTTNVILDSLVERWIEPDDIPFPIP